MIQLTDIHSLSEFQRNAKAHLRQMKRSGRPKVLTVNGKAEIVVQDAKSYQKLLNALDRIEAIEGIKRGLESMKQGKGRPANEVLERIRKKYEIPSA
jgi:PHD/YefM family antitoxin component YafN of YafNO toxin-antitoxin module